jgi:hypothetical protein
MKLIGIARALTSDAAPVLKAEMVATHQGYIDALSDHKGALFKHGWMNRRKISWSSAGICNVATIDAYKATLVSLRTVTLPAESQRYS